MYFRGTAFSYTHPWYEKAFTALKANNDTLRGCCTISQTLANHSVFESSFPLGPAPQHWFSLIYSGWERQNPWQVFHRHQYILSSAYCLRCKATPTQEHWASEASRLVSSFLLGLVREQDTLKLLLYPFVCTISTSQDSKLPKRLPTSIQMGVWDSYYEVIYRIPCNNCSGC